MTEPATREVDVVVIGAGAVGENAADYAHRAGLSTALVESELVGGECSYWACMPSKALLRTADAVVAARRLPGVTAEYDVESVLKRRDAIAHGWDDASQVDWAEGAGISVMRGRARLAGERLVRVGDETMRARNAVVVATGSRPVRPPIPGLDSVRTWTSRDATSAHAVPRRLGVLGGGVVGCELAQAWRRLGSDVVLLVRGPRLLALAEPVASEKVVAGLRRDGVDVRLDTGLETVGLTPDGPLTVADTGLVHGVDGDWLYAAGDVTGRAPLTHQGKYNARIVGAAIGARAAGTPVDTAPWGEHVATADHAAVPQVVFTDPEVASVGRTAAQAREAGLHVRWWTCRSPSPARPSWPRTTTARCGWSSTRTAAFSSA